MGLIIPEESLEVVGTEGVEKLRLGPESLRKVNIFHSIIR